MGSSRPGKGFEGSVASPAPAAAGSHTAAVTSRVRAVPGVTHAVLFNRDGTILGETGRAEEVLAAKSLHLASMIAWQLGEALRMGELQQASVSSPGEQVLLLRSRETYLAISIAGGTSLAEAKAGILQALGQ